MSASKKRPTQFESQSPNPDFPGVVDISPEELASRTDAAHIIDVRMPDEYSGELGHIANSKLIVLNTLPDHIDELPKDEPIVFVCKAGGRSARATAFALENGFQHVFNMQGGMLRWNALGLPTEQ